MEYKLRRNVTNILYIYAEYFAKFVYLIDRWVDMENISAGNYSYYDDQNFPHGFRRSGVFTIKEAEYLESHGQTLRELELNLREPISEDESHFQQAIQTDDISHSFAVNAWRKYKAAISARSQRIFLSKHSGEPSLGNLD